MVDYAQLSVAPWFGLPLCDPKSYPQNPCTPDSDTNGGQDHDPNAAGSAFMELQFYPPGYTPFVDSVSCSATKWCAALTIDSLECTFGFATCNNNCNEPVNFAFLQTNGVPAGPPSPQLTDVSTFMPNAHTLMINPGDVLVVFHLGPAAGVHHDSRRFDHSSDRVHDRQRGERLHEHQHRRLLGHSVHLPRGVQHRQAAEPGAVGRARGRRADAAGDRPRRGLQLGDEQGPVQRQLPRRPELQRPERLRHLHGRIGRPGATGEGPCNATTGICQNATTQGPNGPVACPTNNSTSGALCEFADGYCFQQGTRTVVINGVPATESARTNECFADRFQNGDLDFDGQSYQAGLAERQPELSDRVPVRRAVPVRR